MTISRISKCIAVALLLVPTAFFGAEREVDLPGGAKIVFVEVPAGRLETLNGDFTIQSFFIAATELTGRQWNALMGDDRFHQLDHPARNVTWFELQRLAERLEQHLAEGEVRLPYEVEWEYAARAGRDNGGAAHSLGEFAWTRDNSGGKVQPVAQKEPNAWGLYDVLGNVWEWCLDVASPQRLDPREADALDAKSANGERVRKGGSAVYGPSVATVDHRYRQPPHKANGNLGARLVWLPARSAN